MKEYHKIQTVWLRDPDNRYKTLIEGAWAHPEFGMLAEIPWSAKEKVDGTNIRVIWDGEQVEFRGKTDRAQIPPFLLSVLGDKFVPEKMGTVFDCPVTLYGEGFGHKIQKYGGDYLPDQQDFMLFDAHVGGLWLTDDSLHDIAAKIGILIAPSLGDMTLPGAIEIVRHGFNSAFGTAKAEGLVLKPCLELLNRRGERIITKIKTRDFAQEEE